MSTKSEVATATTTELDPIAQAAIAAQADEFSADDLSVPILKIGQPLTREVQDEQAEPGEFINTLTSEGLGNEIDFIVAFYQQGRAAADRDTGRYYVAFGDTIPDSWRDLKIIGEEFVGTPFDEHPDAEEVYSRRANAKEIEWGKGPQISTTHNYTGLAVISALEGSDEPDELQPVRLSLQRTNKPAVKKINSLYRMKLRNRPFWDTTFNFKTYKKSFNQGSAFLLNPSIGRATDPFEREAAAELYAAVAAGRVTDNSEQAGSKDTAKPDAKGGLDL